MTRTITLSMMAASLLLAAGFGCDDDEHKPSQMLAGWQGPPARLQITVTGPDADDDKRERCGRIARENGILVDPSAPVQGILTLGGGGNRLQIMANGAIVRDDQKPGWDMDHLCNDAILALLSTIRQTGNVAPPPGYAAPPPGYAQPAMGPPMVTIILIGPEADNDKRERCNNILMRNGGSTDPNAAVRAILNLSDHNSLQIVSARRGVVLNEPKPGWGMEQLCNDALQRAQMVLQQEMSAPQQPAYQQPPPGYPQQQAPAAPAGTVAVSPMPASPGAPKNVADLAARGLGDFSRRDYATALVSFQEAAKSSGDSAMIFDAGLCFYMLHRPQEALQHMQLYIDRAPQAPNRPQADALVADLQRQLGMGE